MATEPISLAFQSSLIGSNIINSGLSLAQSFGGDESERIRRQYVESMGIPRDCLDHILALARLAPRSGRFNSEGNPAASSSTTLRGNPTPVFSDLLKSLQGRLYGPPGCITLEDFYSAPLRQPPNGSAEIERFIIQHNNGDTAIPLIRENSNTFYGPEYRTSQIQTWQRLDPEAYQRIQSSVADCQARRPAAAIAGTRAFIQQRSPEEVAQRLGLEGAAASERALQFHLLRFILNSQDQAGRDASQASLRMLSVQDRIRMVGWFGDALSQLYDHDRIGLAWDSTSRAGGEVTYLQILDNLRQGIESGRPTDLGICRDIARAQAQFLEYLGFNETFIVASASRRLLGHVTTITRDPENPNLVHC